MSAPMTYAELLELWRDVRAEILKLEERLMEITADAAVRERELRALYVENGRLRNNAADAAALDAARRLIRRQALIKRDELDLAISASGASFSEKAFLQQQLAHLWKLIGDTTPGAST